MGRVVKGELLVGTGTSSVSGRPINGVSLLTMRYDQGSHTVLRLAMSRAASAVPRFRTPGGKIER